MAKESFFARIKKRIDKKIARYVRKIAGIDEFEDNVFYFLNHGVDITKCKPADGILRQLQLADLELLKIFHKFCVANNLRYFLAYGTLLGAVRHKGFIPWDEDLDVSMPREDFIKAVKLIPEFFGGTGYWFSTEEESVNSRGFIGRDGGILIDIFPLDFVAVKSGEDFISKADKYKQLLKEKGKLKDESERNKLSEQVFSDGEAHQEIYYCGLEFPWGSEDYYEKECIFPLQKITFENEEFFAPNDVDNYLTKNYKNYMEFPRSGVLHHSGLLQDMNEHKDAYSKIVEEMKEANKTVEKRLQNIR